MVRMVAAVFVLALLIPWPCSGFGMEEEPGEAALTAQERIQVESLLPEAEAIILAGFDSDNVVCRQAAVRQMQYLPEGKVYEKAALLFQDFRIPVTTPAMPVLQDAALKTLFILNPEKTLAFLLSHEEAVFDVFDPYSLFSIIGYEATARFGNLFLQILYHEPVRGSARFPALLLASLYLHTHEEKYLDLLKFHSYGTDLTPEDGRFLYAYLSRRQLPVRKLVYTIQERGGVLPAHAVTHRSYSLDELLFQALLYRLRLSDAVYQKQNDSAMTLFPSFLMNEAAACFYAGAPDPRHLSAFQENLDRFPPSMRYRYLSVIADSPDGELRRQLLFWLLHSGDLYTRRMAAAACAQSAWRPISAELLSRLDTDPDPVLKASIMEMIGEAGNRKQALVLGPYLKPEIDQLLRITAAGQMIRVFGGRP